MEAMSSAGTTNAHAAAPENALSWAEVREICGEMEKLYRRDAQKDAARLRALLHKRKQIAAAVESKQSEAAKQLQRMISCMR